MQTGVEGMGQGEQRGKGEQRGSRGGRGAEAGRGDGGRRSRGGAGGQGSRGGQGEQRGEQEGRGADAGRGDGGRGSRVQSTQSTEEQDGGRQWGVPPLLGGKGYSWRELKPGEPIAATVGRGCMLKAPPHGEGRPDRPRLHRTHYSSSDDGEDTLRTREAQPEPSGRLC